MSEYEDDADRLSDSCDNCGESMADCTCGDEEPQPDERPDEQS